MTNDVDFEKLLNKIMHVDTYKGVSIEQRHDGYYALGFHHTTKAQAIRRIDNAILWLGKSIKKNNKS